LFLIANRNIYIKTTIIANTYINIFRKLRDTNTIIMLIDIIDNLYIDKNSNNYRTKSFYLLKFKIDFTNQFYKLI